MTREAAFDAVEKVFAAMAAGDAYNFPVVREAIGHEDALYGFKGGFDRAGRRSGEGGRLLAAQPRPRGIINHQSTVFLFDPDTGPGPAMVGGNLLTALAPRRRRRCRSGIWRARTPRCSAWSARAIRPASSCARRRSSGFEKVIGWNLHPEMLPGLAEVAAEVGLPFEAVSWTAGARRT
jgi:alanine dehydrogenase